MTYGTRAPDRLSRYVILLSHLSFAAAETVIFLLTLRRERRDQSSLLGDYTLLMVGNSIDPSSEVQVTSNPVSLPGTQLGSGLGPLPLRFPCRLWCTASCRLSAVCLQSPPRSWPGWGKHGVCIVRQECNIQSIIFAK